MISTNSIGDIVSGTLIELPRHGICYVGEIFPSGLCKLYSKIDDKYIGLYEKSILQVYKNAEG